MSLTMGYYIKLKSFIDMDKIDWDNLSQNPFPPELSNSYKQIQRKLNG